MDRTRTELILMEILYQLVRTERSSSRSEREALRRAGFTDDELRTLEYDV